MRAGRFPLRSRMRAIRFPPMLPSAEIKAIASKLCEVAPRGAKPAVRVVDACVIPTDAAHKLYLRFAASRIVTSTGVADCGRGDGALSLVLSLW